MDEPQRIEFEPGDEPEVLTADLCAALGGCDKCHGSRLMFPVDHFRWQAASALIADEGRNAAAAKTHAQHALDAAALENSGFRYHPNIGLVTDQYDNLIQKLKQIRG